MHLFEGRANWDCVDGRRKEEELVQISIYAVGTWLEVARSRAKFNFAVRQFLVTMQDSDIARDIVGLLTQFMFDTYIRNRDQKKSWHVDEHVNLSDR